MGKLQFKNITVNSGQQKIEILVIVLDNIISVLPSEMHEMPFQKRSFFVLYKKTIVFKSDTSLKTVNDDFR